jgi:hypothetical protein
MKTSLLKLTCGLALLGAVGTAKAQTILMNIFDGDGFTAAWTGTGTPAGTGTMTVDSTLVNGTYNYPDLLADDLTLNYNLGGYTWPQKGLQAGTSGLTVILDNGFFAFAGSPDSTQGGSADFINAESDQLSFSPAGWQNDDSEYVFASSADKLLNVNGQYAPVLDTLPPPSTPVPEPSTIALAGLAV